MSSNTTTTNNASALTTSTTLRPRTKRLISGLSEGDESAPSSFDSQPRRIASPAPSPFDSRSASPIPAAHPQRASASRTRDEGSDRYAGYSSWGRRAQVGATTQRKAGGGDSPTLANLWGSSWTTLQGIASDFLGNDLPPNNLVNGSPKAKPAKSLSSRLRTSSPAGGSWGPTSNPPSHAAIGSGTRESRENAVRAQKRKDLLTRGDSSYTADALGKIKRRLSDDQHESRSAPPSENEDRAALVYVHHVSKDDTLAGITIKYNCSAAVVRKANRMWPNDTVQSRKTIVLPVDACGVKGKPVSGPESIPAVDLLDSGAGETDVMAAEEVSTPTATIPNGDHQSARDRTLSLSTTLSTASPRISTVDGTSTTAAEPQWTHDSWVLLPHPTETKPTEIARLSRRALGYFPPARRKSISLSDLDTPSTSLDLARTSISTNTTTTTTTAAPDQPQRPRRTRRLSNANNGYFPSYLAGPGGVGTMSSNVLSPGPAQDGLNKIFARHLPDVAPPRNQTNLYQPELPLYTDDETPIASGNVTPSLLPQHDGSLGIENAAGAIESWVRRMATRARTPTGEAGAGKKRAALGPRMSLGAPGKGKDGVGDLIEMTDEFEIGGDEEEEGQEGGRGAGYLNQASAATWEGRGRRGGGRGSGWDYSGGSTSARGNGGGASGGGSTGPKSGKKY